MPNMNPSDTIMFSTASKMTTCEVLLACFAKYMAVMFSAAEILTLVYSQSHAAVRVAVSACSYFTKTSSKILTMILTSCIPSLRPTHLALIENLLSEFRWSQSL